MVTDITADATKNKYPAAITGMTQTNAYAHVEKIATAILG